MLEHGRARSFQVSTLDRIHDAVMLGPVGVVVRPAGRSGSLRVGEVFGYDEYGNGFQHVGEHTVVGYCNHELVETDVFDHRLRVGAEPPAIGQDLAHLGDLLRG